MLPKTQPASAPRFDYVFLDRDGVINRKLPEGRYVTAWQQVELLPGAAEAIAALNLNHRKVIVVTNQRGIALGLMTETDLAGIHDRLRAALADSGAAIDALYYCPHHRDVCNCRKPQLGMIEEAFRAYPGARPGNSILIGDSLSDMECGRAAGMATIFIANPDDAGDRRSASQAAAKIADAVAHSLADAVRMLLDEDAEPARSFDKNSRLLPTGDPFRR